MKRTQNLKLGLLAISLILLTSCKKHKSDPIPAEHPKSAKYQRIVDQFMEAGAAGVSVAVISPEGIWRGAGGMADVQRNIAMTPNHTLRIGSMTKLFTAAAILKLQEEGVLNIKDKINKYIPHSITDRIANANEVTIEQCLNHSSGILNYVNEELIVGYINGATGKFNAGQNLQMIYDKPATDPAGQGSHYSNSNYLLLSVIINRLTGKPAYQVLTEKIISPLGLKNTFASTVIPSSMAKSYFRERDKEGLLQDVTYVDNNFIGGEGALDGGMISNPQDLATFLQALLTGKLLSQQSLNMMKTYRPIDPSIFGNDPDMAYYKEYGLGLMRLVTDRGEALGHDGNVFGFNCKGYYLPAQKTTVVIMLNYFAPYPNSKVIKLLNVKETFNLLF